MMVLSESQERYFIGIDPGMKGAIVCLGSGGRLKGCDQMPTIPDGGKGKRTIDAAALHYIIRGYMDDCDGDAVFAIEKSTTRPGESALSGFKTGVFFGAAWALIASAYCPYVLVRPQEWHSSVCKGESGDPKDRSVKVASRLWPNLPLRGPRGGLLDGYADAACIAEYARRTFSSTREDS